MSPRGSHVASDNSYMRDAGTQTGKAVLLVVVAFLIALGLLRTTGSAKATSAPAAKKSAPATRSATTTTSTSTTTTTVPLVAPSQIKLQVLNGLLTGPLSADLSAKLKANPGYDTLPPDNATHKVLKSAIYVITPGYLPEAKVLANTVGLPQSVINPTIPAPASTPIVASERAQANLVLVIGPDLASKIAG